MWWLPLVRRSSNPNISTSRRRSEKETLATTPRASRASSRLGSMTRRQPQARTRRELTALNEVAFELVLCSGVRIHHDVGVAVELGDGSAEPGGAVGGGWIGCEGNARQGSGDVC